MPKPKIEPVYIISMKILKDKNGMDAIVKRANEIIKERMNTWDVDESSIGVEERDTLADSAWKIAYYSYKIGLIK